MGAAFSKAERHGLIREIVKGARLETQSDLVNELRARGVDCTQATVSRDIKELKLVKNLSESGGYYYSNPGENVQPVVARLLEAFSSGYLHSTFSGNIVILKTVVSMAPSCALAIDAVQWPEVLGTLAGDDTIMIVTKSVSASKKLVKKLETLLK